MTKKLLSIWEGGILISFFLNFLLSTFFFQKNRTVPSFKLLLSFFQASFNLLSTMYISFNILSTIFQPSFLTELLKFHPRGSSSLAWFCMALYTRATARAGQQVQLHPSIFRNSQLHPSILMKNVVEWAQNVIK